MKSFEGLVKMYEEEIFISKNTRAGYDRVLQRIDPLLCGWAAKIYMPSSSFEDIKQELSMITIEGIDSYDPDKKVRLSSFLHNHIKNKIISKLKSVNKLANNATLIKEIGAGGYCPCGNVSYSDENESCPKCKLPIRKQYRSSKEEFSFSSMISEQDDFSMDSCYFESMISNSDSIYANDSSEYDEIDIRLSLESLAEKKLDQKTYELMKMVWIDEHSIKYAAEEMGLSGWGASMKLKNVIDSNIMNELFPEKKDE